MLDLSLITVRLVNSAGVAYGAAVPADHEDVPPTVGDAVENEIIETDEDAGEVEVGGQRWRWRRGG